MKRTPVKRSTKPIKRRATGDTFAGLRNRLTDLISKYVRLKAADENGVVQCVTCPWRGNWKDADSGHFVAGRTAAGLTVLLDPRGQHVQCQHCNRGLRGNPVAYEAFMLKTYGDTVVKELRAARNIVTKLSGYQLQELMREYRTKIDLLNHRWKLWPLSLDEITNVPF